MDHGANSNRRSLEDEKIAFPDRSFLLFEESSCFLMFFRNLFKKTSMDIFQRKGEGHDEAKFGHTACTVGKS